MLIFVRIRSFSCLLLLTVSSAFACGAHGRPDLLVVKGIPRRTPSIKANVGSLLCELLTGFYSA